MASVKYSNNDASTDYVDIHGRPINIVISEKTGDILVPFQEIRKTGFTIYRKSQYSKYLVADKQISNEFNLYMLDCAKRYIFDNKVAFDEQAILTCINNCKKILAEDNHPADVTSSRQPNKFLPNHSLETKSDNNVEISFHRSVPTTPDAGADVARGFSTVTSPRKPATNVKRTSSNQSIITELRREDIFLNERPTEEKPAFSAPKKFPQPQRNNGDTNGFKNNRPNFRREDSSNSDNQNFKSDFKNDFKSDFKSDFKKDFKSDNRDTGYKPNRPNFRQQNADNQNGNQFKPRFVFPAIKFTKSCHEVIVSAIDVPKDPTKKSNCAWVQDTENVDIISEIDNKIGEIVDKQTIVFKPDYNHLYLAEENGSWYRCKITGMSPMRVFFVDYGNTANVNEVKQISDDLKTIPNQVVRISTRNFTFSEGQIIKIQPVQQYDDGTYVVNIMQEETPTASSLASAVQQPVVAPVSPVKPQVPVQKEFFTLPPYLEKVTNGQEVMVIGAVDATLYLRTRKCCEKLREIDQLIENANTNVCTSVKQGQLVLALDKTKNKYQRAVVETLKKNEIMVEFLDHCKSDTVPLNSIKHTTEKLSQIPITYFISPTLKGFEGKEFDENCQSYLQELIQNRTKCEVILTNKDFDLKPKDCATVLSNILGKTNTLGRTLLKDVDVFKPELGVGSYLCNSFVNLDEITLLSSGQLDDHLDKIMIEEIEDQEPYVPVVEEVCLGYYIDTWYRCVVREIAGDEFKVFYIDFGNLDTVTNEKLRKLPDRCKEVPVLGLPCRFVGARDEAVLKEKIHEMGTYQFNIKAIKNDKYEIEVVE